MIPVKAVVRLISEGVIYEKCGHEVGQSMWESGRHALYCKRCDETLYSVQTKVGTYYMSGAETKALADALNRPAKTLI